MVENLKFQILYECPDLDFQASYERLAQSKLVSVDTFEKGNLWVHFRNFKVLFVISPKGKIQVAFEDPKQKEILLEFMKNLLVSTTGKQLVFRPLKQNLTVEYPAPKEIELWWCAEKDSYVHQGEAKYRSIMDCPEFSEANWSKIPKSDKFNLFGLWTEGEQFEEWSMPEMRDLNQNLVRFLLKSRALEKDIRPRREKLREALGVFRKRIPKSESKDQQDAQ